MAVSSLLSFSSHRHKKWKWKPAMRRELMAQWQWAAFYLCFPTDLKTWKLTAMRGRRELMFPISIFPLQPTFYFIVGRYCPLTWARARKGELWWNFGVGGSFEEEVRIGRSRREMRGGWISIVRRGSQDEEQHFQICLEINWVRVIQWSVSEVRKLCQPQSSSSLSQPWPAWPTRSGFSWDFWFSMFT